MGWPVLKANLALPSVQARPRELPVMPLSLLQRLVLKDLLRVHLVTVLALTTILVFAVLIAEAISKGLATDQLLRMIPWLAITTLPVTVPAAALFTVTIVYGRLAHESALTAIAAGGIPLSHVLWPALLLGAMLAGSIHWLQANVVPETYVRMRLLGRDQVEHLILESLRRDRRFEHSSVDYAIVVREVQGQRLLYPTLTRRELNGKVHTTITARDAELRVDHDRNMVEFRLRNGSMLRDGGMMMQFETEIVSSPLPVFTPGSRRRALELTEDQLREAIVDQTAIQEHAADRLAEARRHDLDHPEQDKVAGMLHDLQQATKHALLLKSEQARREALAVASFVFVLLGCPMGIAFHRGGYLGAFAVCLPIMIAYFSLLLFTRSLGRLGWLEPAYGMWLGNVLVASLGLTLLWRRIRHC